MNMTMTQECKQQSFFEKYKKWIVALIGLQLVPVVLLLTIFGGAAIYVFINDDTNFHPYKSYIMKGFHAGYSEGLKDKIWKEAPEWTDWMRYDNETEQLQKLVLAEQKEYLSQFPKSERGIKLAEMKQQGIKLPMQQKLDKRFKTGLDFYADYVDQRVNRNSYQSEEEYNKALTDMAWKVGYAHGYIEGRAGSPESVALRSIKY